MNKTTGKTYISDYLEKGGRMPKGRLIQIFERLAGGSAAFRNHRAAQDRVRGILHIAGQTQSGREALAQAAHATASVALNASFNPQYATLRDSDVTVSPEASDDYAANLIVHKLKHVQQEEAIRRAFGYAEFFDDEAFGYADIVYPALIKEADALTSQAIHAYELDQEGISGPWSMQRFARHNRPLATTLLTQLDQKHGLHSSQMRQALFKTWMKSPNRLSYETEYLDDLVMQPWFSGKLIHNGLIHSNEDLQHIADNGEGYSPLKNLDLTDASFLGALGHVRSFPDILQALDSARRAIDLFNAFAEASETLDLAEDHFGGHGRWKDLPSFYGAQSLTEGRRLEHFGKTLDVIARLSDHLQNIPDGAKRIRTIFNRAEILSRRHAVFKEAIGDALKEKRDMLKRLPSATPI